jgi:microcystin-dependent protein
MVGEYKEIAFNSVPTGWLACDGSAVSRTTYADLFAAIGTNFGVGDGSTTFNLPNRKGRMSVMLDATQTEFNTIGKTGGAKTVTLASSEMPAHVHTFGMLGDSVVHDNFTPGRGSNTPFGSGTTDSTGGGGAHQNLPPYQVGGIVIIKY